MNQVKAQAAKLWQTITDPATAESYRKTGTLTVTILKELGYLLWLVICLVLVFGEWLWKAGYGAGYRFRDWLNNLEAPALESPSSEDSAAFLSETSKNLISAGKVGLINAVAAARESLGIEKVSAPFEVSPSPAPPPAKPTPAPEPKVVTPPPAPPAPTPSVPAAVPPTPPPTPPAA